MKILCTSLLTGLACADIGITVKWMSDFPEHIYPVHWVTPSVRILTFMTSISFVLLHRKKGKRSSGLQFLFWGLLMLAAIPQFRTEIIYILSRNDVVLALSDLTWSDYKAFSYMAYFPLVVCMFLLNCVSDIEPVKLLKTSNPSPELGASFLRRITFQFYDGFMWRGFRRPVEESHVWDLMDDDLARNINPDFDEYWAESIRKGQTSLEVAKKRKKATDEELQAEKKGQTRGSIFPPMVKAFGTPFLMAALYKIVTDVMTFASPQLLG